MNPNSFDQNPDKPRKKGFGCLINALIGIVVIVVVIVGGSWLLIMHSPLPLRFVTKLIEEGGTDSKLKITGVSGSLASGLGFKKIEWNDGEITDLRFRYSGIMDLIRRKELIIYEMHIGSATLNTTFFTDSTEKNPEHSPETEDPETSIPTKPEPEPDTLTADPSSPAPDPSSDFPLRLLRIDRVSLNQITIKNPSTEHTITIPKIEWTDFKVEKNADLQLGELQADSDHLVIKTSTPPASNYQKRVEITLLPKLDPRILKPILIDALIGEKNNKPIFDIKALGDTLTLTSGADGTQRILAKTANLADFIDAPLPNQLHLEAEIDEPTLTVRSGTFLLGTKAFEIQPTTATETNEKPAGTVFLALHRGDDIEIRYEIPVIESKQQQQSFTPVLTSIPTLPPEDLIALLFHDQDFSTLPPQDQEKLRKHLTWFSFSE